MVSEEDQPEVSNSKGCTDSLIVDSGVAEAAWVPDSDVNQDDLIRAQQQKIEEEINSKTCLIGEKIHLDNLLDEYSEEDQVYRAKILDLKKSYESMRKTRPDGNCFFRAFGFSLFHSLLSSDEQEVDRMIEVADKVRDDLQGLGYTFTIDDFYEQFVSVCQEIKDGIIETPEDLRSKVFNESSRSDYIVVFLRLVTSCHLQQNADFYAAFIEDGVSVHEFCKTEVEPMFKESDHIHVIAITDTMRVGVRINYLDRGGSSASKVNVHDFPEGVDNPCIHLLYRPGHYDVLYCRNSLDAFHSELEQELHSNNKQISRDCVESTERLGEEDKEEQPSSSNLGMQNDKSSGGNNNDNAAATKNDSALTSSGNESDGVSCSKALKLDPSLLSTVTSSNN